MRATVLSRQLGRRSTSLRLSATRISPLLETLEERFVLSASVVHPLAVAASHAHAAIPLTVATSHAHALVHHASHHPAAQTSHHPEVHSGHHVPLPTIPIKSSGGTKGATSSASSTGGTVPVQVVNTPTNPVYTVDARTPFVQSLSAQAAIGIGSVSFTVPANSTLTLDYINATTTSIPAGDGVRFVVNATYHGRFSVYNFNSVPTSDTNGPSLEDHPLIFADPGSTVTFSLLDTDPFSFGRFSVDLTGYLSPPA